MAFCGRWRREYRRAVRNRRDASIRASLQTIELSVAVLADWSDRVGGYTDIKRAICMFGHDVDPAAFFHSAFQKVVDASIPWHDETEARLVPLKV